MEKALIEQKKTDRNAQSEDDRLTQLGRALAHTQRLAGIGSLSASTARELTNPLNMITTSCSNMQFELQEDGQEQEMLRYYVALIERSAFRIAQIVQVLQDYARLDEPQMVVTHIKMIVRDSLALVEKQFQEETNIKIVVEIDDDLGTVVCDHNRITQVLINLLTNARDAMVPEGGTIQLRFWPVQRKNTAGPPVKKEGPRQFAFSVKDKGHGIPAELMDQIFQPFFSTRSDGHGVGLGLFVAKGIVDQHNGRIFAVNNPAPGKGATVTVILPLRPAF